MDIESFDVVGNSLTGSLPASMSAWKKVTGFWVYGNKFNGALPMLPFDAMTYCVLLNSPDSANQFSCPWPAGATEKCQKYDPSTGDLSPITNADCHGTAPPTPTPYACIDNQCVARAGGSLSKGACAAMCTPAQLYACTSNTCVKSDTGVTQAVCEANCGHATLRGTGAYAYALE